MEELNYYVPLLPELIVAVGAMLLLMLGAFGRAMPGRDVAATVVAIGVLCLSAGFLAALPAEPATLFEGAFVADDFGRFMKLLVLGGSALVLVMSVGNLSRLSLLSYEYVVLLLLAVLGMMLMISAGDLIALFLGIELQSLALYVVAAIRRDSVRSSEAGLKYFVLGSLSSGMLLYGCSLIYGFTGSVDFSAIASAATAGQSAGQTIGLTIGLVFLLVGIAFKIAAVPFHMWTPDVYEGAPTPVTAFFAAAPKLAAMALLIRVLITAFPGIATQWQQIIVFLSIASMLLGAFAAIGQTNIKRLMAYSSIGHVGYALIGVAADSEQGTQSVLVYLAIYLFMTVGAFACILSMRVKDGLIEDIDALAGLSKTNLPMAFVLAMILFSMAGVPPLAGFFAKFYVFGAAIEAHLYALAVIGVLASVVAAYYYLRVIKIMFFDEARAPFLPVERGAGFVMTICGLFVLLFVLLPAPLVDAALVAARALHSPPGQ